MAYTTIDDPSQYFNTILYSGDGSSSQSITGVGFQPDFSWIKERTSTSGHHLFNSSVGYNKALFSHATTADSDQNMAVASDGYTLGSSGGFNENSQTYVGWNWIANGGSRTTFTESSNNPGGGYQANTTAGFSIVDYTGTGGAGTVSHGLGAEPKVLIVKNRDDTTDWAVYHRNASSAGNDSYLELNTTDAVATAGTVWNDTSPSSSVFTVGTNTKTNTDGEKYIAYCFAEIQGYSKFGSYTGNGNADGPFIYTGFKPAWTMIKNTQTNGYNWVIQDTERFGGINTEATDKNLAANDSSAEPSSASFAGNEIDYLSNGFKLRSSAGNTNASQSYIYLAFAEHPFVSSKGVPVTAR